MFILDIFVTADIVDPSLDDANYEPVSDLLERDAAKNRSLEVAASCSGAKTPLNEDNDEPIINLIEGDAAENRCLEDSVSSFGSQSHQGDGESFAQVGNIESEAVAQLNTNGDFKNQVVDKNANNNATEGSIHELERDKSNQKLDNDGSLRAFEWTNLN